MNDEKLTESRIADLQRLCRRDFEGKFSDFLDGEQRRIVSEKCFVPDLNFAFFGGGEDCERVMYGVFPEWEEPCGFPIKVLEITHKFGELSHRDYLGSILGLGIERSKVGDIFVSDMTAYVFLAESVSDFVANNLKKIGSKGVSVKLRDLGTFSLPEKKFKEIDAVCASMRLDAVVGAATGVSRKTAADMISSGLVKQNHREETNVSKTVSEGDLLSVRGYGRFIADKVGNETRSGRIHIKIKKYI